MRLHAVRFDTNNCIDEEQGIETEACGYCRKQASDPESKAVHRGQSRACSYEQPRRVCAHGRETAAISLADEEKTEP